MAMQGPWANRTTGGAIDTTGLSLGVLAASPGGNTPAVELALNNYGGNALDVSLDGGKTFVYQIPATQSVVLKGSMGDEVFVKAAAATTDVQWLAHGGSP